MTKTISFADEVNIVIPMEQEPELAGWFEVRG